MEGWLAKGASVVLASLIGYGAATQNEQLKDFTNNPSQFVVPAISPLLTKALEGGKSTKPTEMNVNHTFSPVKITMRKKKSAKARGRRAEEDYTIVIVQEKVSETEGKTEKTKKAAAGAEGGKARKKEGEADEKAAAGAEGGKARKKEGVADEKAAGEGGKPNVAR